MTAPASPGKLVETLLGSIRRAPSNRLRRLEIQKVELRGREIRVWVDRARPVTADRTALLTLMRELWGVAAFETGEDLRFRTSHHGQAALIGYLAWLREQDEDEARAVHVHFFGASGWVEPDGPLAGLFPKPLWAEKHLGSAASGGALVLRAIPHARRGALVDRVAAIHMIDLALNEAWRHRDWDKIRGALDHVTDRLASERAALLRECGWLLTPKLDWCTARREALTPEDRKRLRLPVSR